MSNARHLLARKSFAGSIESQRRRTALSLAIATALALPGLTQAQEVAGAEPELEEIVVTGFRQALETSIEAKRESPAVVEALSAEDIGKLPESSIAESLARLPGVSGQRVNGRTSAISIRGFGQDFVAATMNGRELLGMGDNRGVEFDLYPSEIISGATVYKTTTGTLLTQGVAGTVDLQTVRPLSAPETIAVNGMYEQNDLSALNPDMDDNGYRAAASYVDQFAGDTIGVALTVATMESPSQEEWWNAWGYPETPDGDRILGGHKSYVRSAMLNRDSVSGVLEWQPNDKLHVTVDGLYIDYKDEQIKRGLETPGAIWGTPDYTVNTVENGLVTEGVLNNDYVQIRNDSAFQDAELVSGGLNVAYALNDTWSVGFDGAYSEVTKTISDLEIYSGFGRGEAGAGITPDNIGFRMTSHGAVLDYTLPYDDYNLVKLAGAKNWGFDNPHCPGADCTDDQDGFINFADFEETLTALRLQANAKWDGTITGASFGVNYTDREKSKVNTGLFLTVPEYPGNPAIPENVRRGTVALGFLGGQRMVAIDGRQLYDSGYYLTYDEGDFKANRAADTWNIQEKVTTGFLQVDFAGQADDTPVSGNVGLQIVYTDQSADGFGAQGSPTGVIAVPVSDGSTYMDLLPSLNLQFGITDNQKVRFSAARTMTRTRLDKMKPGASIVYDPGNNIPTANLERSPWSANAGNPQLEPIKEDQVDLSYEWYFADDGYVTAGMFNKHLVSWQTTAKVPMDFTQFYYPELGTVYTFEGYSEETIESGGGDIFGMELQFALPLRVLTDALDGFGLIGYYTHLDNSVEVNGEHADVIGLSDESYGVTAYFEKWGFQARVSGNYRSDYTGEVRGNNNGLENTKVLATELWDAQVSYDFGQAGFGGPLEGLSVFLSGSNLTNEPYVQYENDDPRQVKRYSNYGSNYQLGFRYKF
ncbi:MAG TPA: TonB-dependent receptor [Steroidobacteraceae bacterium]|nr:TonB-dependent receptor [Steroidobacteraceae bacterium]